MRITFWRFIRVYSLGLSAGLSALGGLGAFVGTNTASAATLQSCTINSTNTPDKNLVLKSGPFYPLRHPDDVDAQYSDEIRSLGNIEIWKSTVQVSGGKNLEVFLDCGTKQDDPTGKRKKVSRSRSQSLILKQAYLIKLKNAYRQKTLNSIPLI